MDDELDLDLEMSEDDDTMALDPDTPEGQAAAAAKEARREERQQRRLEQLARAESRREAEERGEDMEDVEDGAARGGGKQAGGRRVKESAVNASVNITEALTI